MEAIARAGRAVIGEAIGGTAGRRRGPRPNFARASAFAPTGGSGRSSGAKTADMISRMRRA